MGTKRPVDLDLLNPPGVVLLLEAIYRDYPKPNQDSV
jgi:hypothetical protein